MTELLEPHAIGSSPSRVDGPAKARGLARYAYEQPVDDPLFLHPVLATVTRGRIVSVDTAAAEALGGVEAVLTHENAPRLPEDADIEHRVLQTPDVAFHGQYVGAVLATSPETASEAADLVEIEYETQPHDVTMSTSDDDLYAPEYVNPQYPADTDQGDVDAAFAAAPVRLDETYTTPTEHNNPMEPHSCVATWRPDGSAVTLHDSTQGATGVRSAMAGLFQLDEDQVRVISPYVGGGFGSKGAAHAHNALVLLAARTVPGRPVKLALTRQQMFTQVGHRTPTIQRIRLGADRDGRLTAIAHDVVERTSAIKEFAEQTAVATRMMYAAPNRRTTHRLAARDVPVPSWMRAPGEAPGMFALETAMDELAVAVGVDPIELRVRNEPPTDPGSGKPWADRRLLDCLREGARRFGWERRDPAPGARREGPWLLGTGVASATYPRFAIPGSRASVSFEDGGYVVRIAAADIGTGTWTTLQQIAADGLDVPFGGVRMEIGDTALPPASVAGGSSGISSWGPTIIGATHDFRAKFGGRPDDGDEITADMPDNPNAGQYAEHSFGAHFAEAAVDVDTGELRVRRLFSVFSIGRVVNPMLARSQMIGGMTMGLSMALHEESVFDAALGRIVNNDFAGYHIAAHADVADIDAAFLDEADGIANAIGARGAGEISIVGAAAAIGNAAYHATGRRVRDLPLTPDKLLTLFP